MYPSTKEVLENIGERETLDDQCGYFQEHGEHQAKCSCCDRPLSLEAETGEYRLCEGGEAGYCNSCSLPLRNDGFIDEDRINQEEN